jgi:hypothetical protein
MLVGLKCDAGSPLVELVVDLAFTFCDCKCDCVQCQVKVKVTLRLTVGQSVCLGVEPRLGLMTRY